MSPPPPRVKHLTKGFSICEGVFECPSFNSIQAEFIFKRATTPFRAPRGRVWWHRLASVSQVADMPQPWQRSMALPLTFTASSEAGFSRSRVKRRLGRYHRSSDALKRRRIADSALHCARRRVCPPRLVPANPAPAENGSVPLISTF